MKKLIIVKCAVNSARQFYTKSFVRSKNGRVHKKNRKNISIDRDNCKLFRNRLFLCQQGGSVQKERAVVAEKMTKNHSLVKYCRDHGIVFLPPFRSLKTTFIKLLFNFDAVGVRYCLRFRDEPWVHFSFFKCYQKCKVIYENRPQKWNLFSKL